MKPSWVPPNPSMLSVLALVFCALFSPVAGQFGDGGGPPSTGFHPDSVAGVRIPASRVHYILSSLRIQGLLLPCLCLFTLAYCALSIWACVALIMSRGHRAPLRRPLPLPALRRLVKCGVHGGNHRREHALQLAQLQRKTAAPDPGLYWALRLLFLATILLILNRETALKTATQGTSGGHKPCAARGAHHACGFDVDIRHGWWRRSPRALAYAYGSCVVLMSVDVVVSTVLLWRAWRGAGISDKMPIGGILVLQITNLMLYAVVPLWALLSLVNMVFCFVLSPSSIAGDATLYEGAALADFTPRRGTRNRNHDHPSPHVREKALWTIHAPAMYIGAVQPYVHASLPPAPAPKGAVQPGPGAAAPAADDAVEPRCNCAVPRARTAAGYEYAAAPATAA
ncbi:hypothetical protein C8J57DRAFT_1587008 [Mycena rebaudengoi]|nr:hypothetical protein C8J57DRAFT_1587008 [Mycena rebaudengoi]